MQTRLIREFVNTLERLNFKRYGKFHVSIDNISDYVTMVRQIRGWGFVRVQLVKFASDKLVRTQWIVLLTRAVKVKQLREQINFC